MDWILALGGLVMISIGIVGKIRADWLWRLYSLEPRWRKDNPDKPEDWSAKASKQGNYIIIIGMIAVILSVVLAGY